MMTVYYILPPLRSFRFCLELSTRHKQALPVLSQSHVHGSKFPNAFDGLIFRLIMFRGVYLSTM
jgi:hypothetical protein